MENELPLAAASLSIEDHADASLQVLNGGGKGVERAAAGGGDGICAICLEKIRLEETALVKGCEHAYCVSCILIWATYNRNPSCPQCKHSFQFLHIHRSLDGQIHDYMFEESVCLLLRACWFVPLQVECCVEKDVEQEETHSYEFAEYEDDDLEDSYYSSSSSSLRIGNRRWGDNGYIRAGRKEARPVDRERFQEAGGAGSSRNQNKGKEIIKDGRGRRAKRAMKREAADKAAAAKQQIG